MCFYLVFVSVAQMLRNETNFDSHEKKLEDCWYIGCNVSKYVQLCWDKEKKDHDDGDDDSKDTIVAAFSSTPFSAKW